MKVYQEPEKQPPLLLSYRQAGVLIGVSDRTVWQLVKDGELAVVRFRGTVRIDRRDLETFIQQAKKRQRTRL